MYRLESNKTKSWVKSTTTVKCSSLHSSGEALYLQELYFPTVEATSKELQQQQSTKQQIVIMLAESSLMLSSLQFILKQKDLELQSRFTHSLPKQCS